MAQQIRLSVTRMRCEQTAEFLAVNVYTNIIDNLLGLYLVYTSWYRPRTKLKANVLIIRASVCLSVYPQDNLRTLVDVDQTW